MPSVVQLSLIERVPVPSLRTYLCGSWVLLGLAFAFATAAVADVGPESRWSTEMEKSLEASTLSSDYAELIRSSLGLRLFFFALHDPFSLWSLVNFLASLAALGGAGLIRLVFGPLRSPESAALKERFWNFAFHKFVFVFGVLYVERADEAAGWFLWLTAIGLLLVLSSLAQDRLAFAAGGGGAATGATERRRGTSTVLLLCGANLLSSGAFLLAGVGAGGELGWHYAAFLAADAGQLLLRNLHSLLRYSPSASGVSERTAEFHYYTDLCAQVGLLVVDLAHHLHMLLWSHIGLSVACLVIGVQLRQIWLELDRRLRRHRANVRILAHIRDNFPEATAEAPDEVCPICWEGLGRGRRLPCAHLFHEWCLRGWLEQDPSCPTCRAALPLVASAAAAPPGVPANAAAAVAAAAAANPAQQFRLAFDGGRYARWLPSFSLELTHNLGQLLRPPPAPPVSASQLNSLATQVLEMFPQLEREAVLADLAQTNSLDLTIENVLEGRLAQARGAGGLPGLFEESEGGEEEEEDEDEEEEAWSTEYESEEGPEGAASASSSASKAGPRLAEPYVSPSFSPAIRAARVELVKEQRRRYLQSRGLSETDLLFWSMPSPSNA